MRPLSSLPRNQTIAAAILAAVLVLAGVSIFVSTKRVPPPRQASRPIFSIDKIDGIRNVISTLATDNNPLPTTHDSQPTLTSLAAAVLPHHTIASAKLLELWSDIAACSEPSVIVIVSPNHENAGEGTVQTTHGVWTTPFGAVETDDALVDALVAGGTATDERKSFVNEHGIGTHVSYVAKLFPGVPIVPVIAKSPADMDDALALVRALQKILPDDALVIASVDFCHYLPADATAKMDAETMAYVADRRYDQLERLHSDHLDSPFALIAYLLWSDAHDNESNLVWHDSSHTLMNDPNAPGTSYLVYFSSTPLPPTTHNPLPTTHTPTSPITLTAAGDVMLGRYVATVFSRTTMDAAFADAQSVFAGSDIGFVNLESVLTSSDRDTGKEIHFKADPARTDVLQYLGLTHVSVANNHVDDYGRAGWEESVEILKTADVVPVGDYADDQEPTFSTVGDTTFAFLAYADVYRALSLDRLASDVAAAKERADVVIVSFHWGVEYSHGQTARQVELAHAAIDDGADLVIGSHPHVLGGIETYHDGLILYSLGNFVFDQDGVDQNESAVAKLAFPTAENGTRSLELIPMRIRGTFPRVATENERLATLARIATWSNNALPEDFATTGRLEW